MRITHVRVQNYRSIDDTGFVPMERVTALVGRNESGKTTFLKALHKFNPATPEPYDPQREFPRDRFTREFKNGKDWPVCSIRFAIEGQEAADFKEAVGAAVPKVVECTRFYDGSLKVEFQPEIKPPKAPLADVKAALKKVASDARRIPSPSPEQEEATQAMRANLAAWAAQWTSKLDPYDDGRPCAALLAECRTSSDGLANPQTADIIEALHAPLDAIVSAASVADPRIAASKFVTDHIPRFIYFENYGILDSAIYLPRFVEDLKRDPHNPRVRTINAMFRHVELDPASIAQLGTEQAAQARQQGQTPSGTQIAEDQRRKEERAIRLNSASNDITTRFGDWWTQRRHKIRYHADGDYFRIWIADNRRPDVEIELEARSKGFQWFFSFYLVFLVESEDGHADAVLLLDEPGLHLHPTAQQGLMSFFETLSEKNPVIYSTHSPFLIDGENLHRVRPVTEGDDGHARISVETWPKDRETIFPIQAAAGYAMLRGLFQHKDNVLVEGMSDYYYLHALSQQCHATGRKGLPDRIYITPCGGTKMVGHIASLFLGENVRPVVLLDSDQAGRQRQDALIKELYAGEESAVVMLDAVLGGSTCEIEDILGEGVIVPALNAILSKKLKLNDADRAAGSLPDQIKACAQRMAIELPDGWKATVARNLVSQWSSSTDNLGAEILDRAATLFETLASRFKA